MKTSKRNSKTTNPKTPVIDLPKGMVAKDLEYPSWRSKDRVVETLTLYHVGDWGWCIATLHIRNAPRFKRQNTTARTYAVRIDTESTVRIGLGPHVTKTVSVYVRESRKAALDRYLKLAESGAVEANTIRDRISTRRAQGALRRGSFGLHW